LCSWRDGRRNSLAKAQRTPTLLSHPDLKNREEEIYRRGAEGEEQKGTQHKGTRAQRSEGKEGEEIFTAEGGGGRRGRGAEENSTQRFRGDTHHPSLP